MAPRNPGLAGIVRSPTVATVNRTGLSPSMQNLLGALDKAGYGDVGFNSGYRSPTTNSRVRGAKNSQHLTGNAGDLNTAGMSPDRVLGMLNVAAQNNVNGIGLYSTGNSLHLDTRNGPRAVWGVNGSYRSAPPSEFPTPFQGFVTNFLGQRVPAAVNPIAPVERAALPTATIARYGASMRPTPRPGQPQQTSTGLGLPDAPAAPDQPGVFSQGGFIDRNRGALAGGLLGTIAGGPIGGLLGGFLGNAAQNARMGTPSETARSAFAQGWDGVSAQPGVSQANVVERRSLPDLPTAAPNQPAPSMPGYAGQPAVPGAPEQPGFMGRVTAPQNRGALVGSILGGAAAGPVGGLLGNLAGRALQNSSKGSPSNAASAAMNAGWDGFSGMTSAQSNAARGAPSGGGSSGWSGGGGLFGGIANAIGGLFSGSVSSSGSRGGGGFSSGAVGPDGGKVGGSSSSSGSKSSSGGKKK